MNLLWIGSRWSKLNNATVDNFLHLPVAFWNTKGHMTQFKNLNGLGVNVLKFEMPQKCTFLGNPAYQITEA